MGAAYEMNCEKCGYQSPMVYLGRTRDSLQEQIVGTCGSCKELTGILNNRARDDCALCDATSQVTATAKLNAPKLFGIFGREAAPKYQCPKCGAFSVEVPDTPAMFVD